MPKLSPPVAEADLFGTPASALGVRHPVILGEFPGNGPAQHPEGKAPPETTLGEYLEFAVSAGYAGAWPWSFSGDNSIRPDPGGTAPPFARGIRSSSIHAPSVTCLSAAIELFDGRGGWLTLLLQACRNVLGTAHDPERVQPDSFANVGVRPSAAEQLRNERRILRHVLEASGFARTRVERDEVVIGSDEVQVISPHADAAVADVGSPLVFHT